VSAPQAVPSSSRGDRPQGGLPPGPFKLALMDPPWAFRTFAGKTRTPTLKKFREAEDHYATMSVAEMAALPVGEMMDKDSVLAMWVVGSHCDAAIELAAAWGFRFTTDLFCWLKQKLIGADQIDLFTGDIPPPRMSMGYYTRKQKEDCWLFTRGRGLPVLEHDVRQVIVEPRAGHSRKPAAQYDRLERLFGDVPRIELFARNTRPGWASWGNEVGKFDPAPAQVAA
jgi:N6-adenosine-specific RNA methylase IME4